MNAARTLPLNWRPADGMDYSVEVMPDGGGKGRRIYDIAPAGWGDYHRWDNYPVQGPWDRVSVRYDRSRKDYR